MSRTIALLLTLAVILSATEANAQHIIRRGHASKTVTSTSSPVSGSYGVMTSQQTRTYSSSYPTLSAYPARTYGSQGSTDFVFHGVPYGHAFDPWTWPMMSGSYGNGMARYYDPPVK